ncbi:MAG: nucleotidyltransferase substrate binding protein [Armatimonadetes bacterium]|nr:nucleotidyltransferase substrate binding protein [Armatimonadota bacterium]
MEKLKQRLCEAQKAWNTLMQAVSLEVPSTLERDGCIQRFEYTLETVWKAGQHYLNTMEGIVVAFPKSCFRSLGETGILDEEETVLALAMTDDRNSTTYTYIKALAQQIHGRLARYTPLMGKMICRMASRVPE